MKIILLYVASLDGKLTKWGQGDIHDWVSQEDQSHFWQTLNANNLIVMGSNTFTTANVKPVPGTLRVVMTRQVKKFAKQTVPGQLEFSAETPEQLVKRLEKLRYKQMLLVSGRKLTTIFFQKQLIDEIWITIEPKLFGLGDSLLDENKFAINLKLISTKKLNPRGTLLLKYKVVNQ